MIKIEVKKTISGDEITLTTETKEEDALDSLKRMRGILETLRKENPVSKEIKSIPFGHAEHGGRI